MEPSQSLAQVGIEVRLARLRDSGDRDRLDKEMRRKSNDSGATARVMSSIQKCDRTAIAMSEYPRRVFSRIHLERRKEAGQYFERLLVHESAGPVFIWCPRCRAAITRPGVNKPAAVKGTAKAFRKITPHGDRPQTFVEKNDQGRGDFLFADPAVFQMNFTALPENFD